MGDIRWGEGNRVFKEAEKKWGEGAVCNSSRKPQVKSPVHQAELWVGELKGDGWADADWRGRRDKVGEMKGFPDASPELWAELRERPCFPRGISYLLGDVALVEAAACKS